MVGISGPGGIPKNKFACVSPSAIEKNGQGRSLVCLCILFYSINFLKNEFIPGAIPWADSLAAATAFAGMWLMTRKKVESWYWWIATNICSVPLYFTKGWVVTSLYYFILLFLAFAGLNDWKKRATA